MDKKRRVSIERSDDNNSDHAYNDELTTAITDDGNDRTDTDSLGSYASDDDSTDSSYSSGCHEQSTIHDDDDTNVSETREKKTFYNKKGQGNLLRWTQELKEAKARAKPRVQFSANVKDKDGQPSHAVVVREKETGDGDSIYDNPDCLESDDDEGDVNRIGNVPLWWYDNMKHIGYDSSGKRLERSLDVSEISTLLRNADDPEAWRNIPNIKNQNVLRLSDTDLEIIRRIKAGRYPSASFDPYGPDSVVVFDDPEAAIHPTSSAHPPKRRFLPSLWENKRINYLVKLIREGRIRADPPKPPEVYDVWGESIVTEIVDAARGLAKGPPPLPTPKAKLPGNAESYNPPEEYLLTSEEEKEWISSHPEDREQNFLPRKYNCLRRVPAYTNNLIERFQRCLDLYLCPRSVKMRMNVDPDSLLPQLPSPESLRPFPTRLGVSFESSDASAATSVAFDSTSTYLAVARHSGFVEVFDARSSRLVLKWAPQSASVRTAASCDSSQPGSTDTDSKPVGSAEPVSAVSFSPTYPLLAVAHGCDLYILLLPLPALLGTCASLSETAVKGSTPREQPPSHWDSQAALQLLRLADSDEEPDQHPATHNWEPISDCRVKGWKIAHASRVTSVAWHPRGLYFVSVCRHAGVPSQQLAIHALSKLKSIRPFRKCPGGRIQKAIFHPNKPWLFVAYQRGVRVYNLQKSDSRSPSDHRIGGLVKKFSGATDILDFAVHASGDHLVVGGENQRVTWFDYDLGERPYKILRYHKAAVRSVGFHPSYPLLFSGSADGTIHIFHAKVFTDLMNAPAIVPVKKLTPAQDFLCTKLNSHAAPSAQKDPVLFCSWHPYQPWLVAALRSGKIGIFV